MPVDYNNISKTFSQSRKNMKWEEIEYFLNFIQNNNIKNTKILDIGCGSGRLLGVLRNTLGENIEYTGIDSSSGMIEEAKIIYPDENFSICDMGNLQSLGDKKYDCIFFIASFHHLENTEQRLDTLKKAITILNNGGYIFMTHWSLESELNKEKYAPSKVQESENIDGGVDFQIKLGEYKRFYHCFTTNELDVLFKKNDLNIIENREFENKRNFISILQKQ